jgi:uncharacterized Rmd1/YagE family protein
MKTYRITAINTAENFDFINFKPSFSGTLITYNNFELFFHISDNQYIGMFQNGVIVFANFSQIEISSILDSLKKYMINVQNNISETVEILLTDTDKVYAENNVLYVPQEYDDKNIVRIVMNDLVQVLGVEFYSKIAENLLGDVKKIATKLETKGRVALAKKDRNKFIGSCLTTKNRIADNLYIFDTPNLVWDDERLGKIHTILTESFNLKARLKEIDYTLSVINDNLQIFMQIFEYSHASKLEIIVIWLIIFEIVTALAETFHILK